MQRTDKLLLGIVIGIVVLVVAAFAVLLLRPGVDYVADDTPEHIIHNYLLALERDDLDRAYLYLWPNLPGYPRSAASFGAHIRNNSWQFDFDQGSGSSTFDIGAAVVAGDLATVRVDRRVFYEGGLFGSGNYTRSFNVSLRRSGPTWKITEADEFWHRCWSSPSNC